MRIHRINVVVMALLLSLVAVPSVSSQTTSAEAVEPTVSAPPGTFKLNGGSCPFSEGVDVDLVVGGAWVLWSSGWIWDTDLGDGPVVEPRETVYVPFEEGECAVELVLTSGGYLIFTTRGRVVAVGAAVSHGDLSAVTLNDPIVAAAPTPSGNGYYMLGADGGVFSFGDAQFYGSVQGIVDETVGRGELASEHLHAPIVTMATTPAGYWLIAADGTVFPFGDAPYHGSIQDVLNTGNQLAGVEREWALRPPVARDVPLAKDALVSPIVDVVPSGEGAGYMMLASDGGIFNFGQTQFHGSAAGTEGWTAVASDVTPMGDGYVIFMTEDDGYKDDIRAFGSVVKNRRTLQGVFEHAAARRQWLIDGLAQGIRSGTYGVGEDRVLRGPAGFSVNIGECPDDWSDVAGVNADEIRIGYVVRQSEGLTADDAIAVGWQNYFDWVNANDPIMVNGEPRKLTLVTESGGRTASRADSAIDELLSGDSVFSIHTSGDSTTLALYGRIGRDCVPHPFAGSPHPALGDPVNHPWTTGLEVSYTTEARLWGESFSRYVPYEEWPATVVALVTDNAVGRAYEQAFKEWADREWQRVDEFISVRHDPEAESVSQEIRALMEAEPDIFFSMTDGSACVLAMEEAADAGLVDEVNAVFTPRACSDIATYMKPAGRAADGWLAVGNGVVPTSVSAQARRPFVAWMNDNLRAANLDPSNERYAQGYVYGYPYVEALRIAAALPGGLTRSNFLLAVRSTDVVHPLLFENVPFDMYGNGDAFPIEGAAIRTFDYMTQTWRDRSVRDDNDGTPNCAWDAVAGTCR